MVTSTTYKGLTVVDETGVSLGSVSTAWNANFKELADRAGPVIENAGDPDANDDSADTNGNGTCQKWSLWHNTTTGIVWVCLDATATAAKWKLLEVQTAYTPHLTRFPRLTETVLSNFQSGHGFTKGGTGTQSDDTSVYIKGSQSLKLVTNGAQALLTSTKSGISPAIDLTGKFLKVWVRCSDVSELDRLMVYVSTAGIGSDYVAWSFPYGGSPVLIHDDDVWQCLSLPWGEGSTSGSTNRASIAVIYMCTRDKSNSAVTVNMGGIAAVPEPANGVLSLVFDDGMESQFTAAKPVMDNYDFPGTAYIIPSFIGTVAGRMTEAQIFELQEYHGWDIASHETGTLVGKTSEAVAAQLIAVKEWLLARGFKAVDHFAYPGGAYDATVLEQVRRYFTTARTTANFNETYPSGDHHRLRTMIVTNVTSTATIAGRVTQALNNNEWLILTFHDIVTPADTSGKYTPTDFETVIDDIATQGIKVRPVSHVMDWGVL